MSDCGAIGTLLSPASSTTCTLELGSPLQPLNLRSLFRTLVQPMAAVRTWNWKAPLWARRLSGKMLDRNAGQERDCANYTHPENRKQCECLERTCFGEALRQCTTSCGNLTISSLSPSSVYIQKALTELFSTSKRELVSQQRSRDFYFNP